MPSRVVALVTLGCARNEVDSEELAGRLTEAGWALADKAGTADVVLVNTCGFIDAAKKDSIDTLLAAAETGAKVVATGCLAERYGCELATALPEAHAVLSFDAYPHIAARLEDVLAERPIAAHQPTDRRALLPVAPRSRPPVASDIAVPGHAWLPTTRRRLNKSPMAYLKLASGCDRRCSFCAIPSFRGSFVSRAPAEVLAEARWLTDTGARELVLVSENTTSYGKDLGDVTALERLLDQLNALDGIARIRLTYLQPAELRPSLISAITQLPRIARYFDLSFQHASPRILRAMRRFGSASMFLDLLARIRELSPNAGVRSNVIVGFPGETEDDLDELQDFLTRARLDAVGVFGYSDEEGTSAAQLDGKLPHDVISERVSYLSALADELMTQRAEDRIGERVDVLVQARRDSVAIGTAGHQGPDVDGVTHIRGDTGHLRPGDLCEASVVRSDGVDLTARLGQ